MNSFFKILSRLNHFSRDFFFWMVLSRNNKSLERWEVAWEVGAPARTLHALE